MSFILFLHGEVTNTKVHYLSAYDIKNKNEAFLLQQPENNVTLKELPQKKKFGIISQVF